MEDLERERCQPGRQSGTVGGMQTGPGEDRGSETKGRVRRVGQSSSVNVKNWTCSKSSSAVSGIMTFHGSAFLTISNVQGYVRIVLLSLKTGNSVPLHMVTRPEISIHSDSPSQNILAKKAYCICEHGFILKHP